MADPEVEVKRRRVEVERRRFEGCRVLVTGGSDGIGGGIADAFTDEGATVLIADVQVPLVGRRFAEFYQCDAASPADIERCCKDAVPVDILVNNVGYQPEAPCHEHTLEDWSKCLAVNLTSYFLFAKHVLPAMLSKGSGIIINVSSVQASQSQPGIPAYAASKGGVLALTRQLAVEYASKGVRVNAVSPGTIKTPLVDRVLAARESSAEQAGQVYPIKRIGHVSEVAKCVLFLASDEASFVAGENFVVDGGIMALGSWAAVA